MQPAVVSPTDDSQQYYPQLNGLQHGCTPEDLGACNPHALCQRPVSMAWGDLMLDPTLYRERQQQ